jgi:hypothetical protein
MSKPTAASLSRFRTVALLRLARLETGWLSLSTAYQPALAAALARDLRLQKEDARTIGAADVVEVSERLEKLVAASEQRKYVLPADIEVVATMAIHLLGLLIRGERSASVDVPGFLRQIEDAVEALRTDAPLANPPAAPRSRREAPGDARSTRPSAISTRNLPAVTPDHPRERREPRGPRDD